MPMDRSFTPVPRTMPMTCARLAPSARRMPISRVCCATECEITP